MNPVEEDILMHYGVKRRSGRYPWGSGENPFQRSGDFLSRVEELEAQGMSELEVAEALGMKTTDLRMQKRVAKHERRAIMAEKARSMRDDGKTLDEIAKELGFDNDSSVRALLNENTARNKNKAQATAEMLKKELEEKGAIDVGAGVERQLGVSSGVLQEALFILETEGYNRYGVGVPQVNDPKKRTITPVISKPDISQYDAYQDLSLIKSVGEYHSTDGGESWDKREYPASIDSSRVSIRYGDQGGKNKDGVIEIRRGVADLDLGDSHYAQVRILVDGTHYLKGISHTLILFERRKNRMSEITNALTKKLREIWDHDDFVEGVLAFADNDEDRQAVLDFIEAGDDVTTDTISLCALDLNIKRYGEQ